MKDPVDGLSIIGMICAIVVIIVGFTLYFVYLFGERTPNDGINAVFQIGFGYLLLVLGQLTWYGRRLTRLEREVETLRGKGRPE
jgi:hypothetical protein